MFADASFSNAFVADGIIPDDYGLRTIVEFRNRLFTVSSSDNAPPTPSRDAMHIVNSPQRSLADPITNPQPPNASEGEHALRALAAMLDLSTIGPLNPILFALLRVPPPRYVRMSSLAAKKASTQNQTPRSVPEAVVSFLRSKLNAPEPRRDTELSLLSWHWADDILAIASGSELDRLCAYHFPSGEWQLTGERHHSLYNIRSLSFRPYSGRSLAIGCHSGLVYLEGHNLSVLSPPSHTDVASLDWSPDGQLVASASTADRTVRLTDVATRLSISLGRGSMVLFSPSIHSQLLFIADSAAVNFRLFDCRSHAIDRWGSLSGPVVAATWTPDGSTLLFSMQEQSSIHVLTVSSGRVRDSTLAHVEMTSLPREGPGGPPVLLEVDPTGERLAVAYEVPDEDAVATDAGSFSGEDPHRRYAVALYALQLRPSFALTPIGYVSGPKASGPPVAIKFKPQPAGAAGAILTCMWRSGEVSFTHLFFHASRD